MAKTAHNDLLDNGPQYLKDHGTIMTACSAQPTTYAEAITTYKLADVVMVTGDFTVSDGDTNGRKVRVAQKADVPVDTDGTANHVAICETAISKLLLVTTCTPQALTAGNTVTFPAFDDEISDPT